MDVTNFSILKEEDEQLLIDAIVEIMEENDAHNLYNFSAIHWRWQNKQLPSGESQVYIMKREDNAIAAYYHVPIYIGKFEKGVTRYAMIQDVAVSDSLRGKGIFKELASFANNSIDEKNIDVVYTFPNTKSIKTFTKYNGFTNIGSLPAYILPLNSALIFKNKFKLGIASKGLGYFADLFFKFFGKRYDRNLAVKKHNIFDKELEAVYSSYSSLYEFGLQKDVAYLNWRFVKRSPHYIFSITSADDPGQTTAVAVFKKDSIMSMHCLLLMDFAYLPGKSADLLELITDIKNNQTHYLGEQVALIFTSSQAPINLSLRRAGFLKIPESKNPRLLNLLVRSPSGNEDVKQISKWNITLCDWDVF